MTLKCTTTSIIQDTEQNTKGFTFTFSTDATIQRLYPLPLKATGYHTLDDLRRRHMILTELHKHDDLHGVAENFCQCHHPDNFRILACGEHPEAQAINRPHSCGETTICESCAGKHHRFEAARWTHAITQHMLTTPTYYKPHHITFTTSYQLGTGDDSQQVAIMMTNVTLSIRQYFKALAKVARWEQSKRDYRNNQCTKRKLKARLNALRDDDRALELWYDLRRSKNPHWWRRTRNKLAAGKTLKQLNMGGLFSVEFGEKSQHLHAHMYYHGNPLNWSVMQKIWHDITGFTFVKIQPFDSTSTGVQEVTKYATKLTTCPVEKVPLLYNAFKGQRRIRAIGSFHGLIAEHEEQPEKVCCNVCGGRLMPFTESGYQNLIFLITGDNSSNSEDVNLREHPPPLLEQLPLI